MEVGKKREKPDLEVVLSAGLVAFSDSVLSGHSLRSFALLISPAVAFYAAISINYQFDNLRLAFKQKRYDKYIDTGIRALDKELDECDDQMRKAEIAEEIKKLRAARFENTMQRIEFAKPDYDSVKKSRKGLKR